MAKEIDRDPSLLPTKSSSDAGKRPSRKPSRSKRQSEPDLPADALPVSVHLVLISRYPPRTKKNSQQIVKRGRFRKIIPSQDYTDWLDALRIEGWDRITLANIPWNCQATIYRERNVGDANNYYAAIADALQHYKVVQDDKWIKAWDGSRLRKDDENPRVEIVLTPLMD